MNFQEPSVTKTTGINLIRLNVNLQAKSQRWPKLKKMTLRGPSSVQRGDRHQDGVVHGLHEAAKALDKRQAFPDLLADPTRFYNYLRMSADLIFRLCSLIVADITKTKYKLPRSYHTGRKISDILKEHKFNMKKYHKSSMSPEKYESSSILEVRTSWKLRMLQMIGSFCRFIAGRLEKEDNIAGSSSTLFADDTKKTSLGTAAVDLEPLPIMTNCIGRRGEYWESSTCFYTYECLPIALLGPDPTGSAERQLKLRNTSSSIVLSCAEEEARIWKLSKRREDSAVEDTISDSNVPQSSGRPTTNADSSVSSKHVTVLNEDMFRGPPAHSLVNNVRVQSYAIVSSVNCHIGNVQISAGIAVDAIRVRAWIHRYVVALVKEQELRPSIGRRQSLPPWYSIAIQDSIPSDSYVSHNESSNQRSEGQIECLSVGQYLCEGRVFFGIIRKLQHHLK
nr:unnamed protein product [Callosobruchus chinensis]